MNGPGSKFDVLSRRLIVALCVMSAALISSTPCSAQSEGGENKQPPDVKGEGEPALADDAVGPLPTPPEDPVGDGIMYQGELRDVSGPVTGSVDFRFRLYDDAAGGVQIGPALEWLGAPLVDGRFSVELDFGPGAFTSEARWLEIDVYDAGAGSFVTLAPRQSISAAPVAHFALAGNEGPQGPIGPAGPQGPAGDSHWLMNGSATYYNAGNVGVGTTTPTSTLSVNGDADFSGSVGIGTTAPANAMLSVNGVADFSSVFVALRSVSIGRWNNGAGRLRLKGANGNLNVEAGPADWQNYPNHGAVNVMDSLGGAQAGMYVDFLGQGVVWGDWKFFRADNPYDPETEIWYGCLEGPEQAVYIRGTGHLIDGEAVIEFPDHFRAVAKAEGMTIQLTPLSANSLGLSVVHKDLQEVRVRELVGGKGTYDFDYTVTAARQGSESFDVIRPIGEGPSGSRPDNRAPAGNANADEAVAARPAPRGTPNEIVRSKDAEIAALRADGAASQQRIDALEARLSRMEELLANVSTQNQEASR